VTLSADHGSPATGSGANALDYYGYWKLSAALLDAAFDGENRQFALGNTPEQRFMGVWSNGRLFKKATVFDLSQPLEISAIPAAVEAVVRRDKNAPAAKPIRRSPCCQSPLQL
jgi:hypothetical protein